MGRPVHQKLILPGDVERRGGLTIHVPRGYESTPGARVGICTSCKAVFRKGEEEAWQRHVGPCARANLDAVRAEAGADAQKGTIFDENMWDPEAAAHLKEVGKRMLKEGRMTLHKSERVGS